MLCRLCGLWVDYLVGCHELKACRGAVCSEDTMIMVRRSWIDALLSNRRRLMMGMQRSKQDAGRYSDNEAN
jgi:hypothetical protein